MGREVSRVVLDTNLVLSALIFQSGRLAPLRLLWQKGIFVPLVSHATASELIRALGYPKFKLSDAGQEELLADYLPYCLTVKVPDPSPAVPACRDPADLPFLELALAGKADLLVTGDQDLLVPEGSFACRIVAAEAFLRELGTSR